MECRAFCWSGLLLTFGYKVEQVEEFGEADGCGFGAANEGFAMCAQRGDAEGHGDTMIAAGVDSGSVKPLAAGDVHAIFMLGDFGSHGAEILDDESDPVGLLDA